MGREVEDKNKQKMPPSTRRVEVGASATPGSEEHFMKKRYGLCRRVEHRTRDCKERETEKCVVLAKMNVPANSEGGLVAATAGAARGDGKENWDSNIGASLYTSHTQAGMTSYKKAPSGTTVEVTDGTILPVDGFGIVEMYLDQPGDTTKPVKMVSVAYVPGLSRNLMSIRKTVEQMG